MDKYPHLKAIAINSMLHSSLIFKDVFEKYHVGFVYHYNGTCMNYSVYRLGLEPEVDIPCWKIAQSYGGGGHAGAAGFRRSRLRDGGRRDQNRCV